MATYTVIGHPLNYATLALPDFVCAAIQATGVGQTIAVNLSGPDEAKVKGHGVLK
jgi:hypothetical protein